MDFLWGGSTLVTCPVDETKCYLVSKENYSGMLCKHEWKRGKRLLRGLWEGGLIPFFKRCVPKDSSSAKLEAQYWMGWEEAIRGKGDHICAA